MEDISDNSHYIEYIQFFFNKINKFKSSKNISLLINSVESLIETSKKETTKNGQMVLQKKFLSLINIYYNIQICHVKFSILVIIISSHIRIQI